jgi:hypothetical protein
MNAEMQPWPAWRYNNIVYYRNYKTASTLYLNLFEQHLQWQQTTIADIDWQHDKVFAHIRHPYKKYISALAEFVAGATSTMSDSNLVSHPDYIKTLTNSVYLDGHGVALYDIFGHYAEQIDWIPIDSEVDHFAMTVEFLKHAGLTDSETYSRLLHAVPRSSSNISKNSYNKQKLIELLTQVPLSSQVMHYLDYDVILYDAVINNFDSGASTWPSISWLGKRP